MLLLREMGENTICCVVLCLGSLQSKALGFPLITH